MKELMEIREKCKQLVGSTEEGGDAIEKEWQKSMNQRAVSLQHVTDILEQHDVNERRLFSTLDRLEAWFRVSASQLSRVLNRHVEARTTASPSSSSRRTRGDATGDKARSGGGGSGGSGGDGGAGAGEGMTDGELTARVREFGRLVSTMTRQRHDLAAAHDRVVEAVVASQRTAAAGHEKAVSVLEKRLAAALRECEGKVAHIRELKESFAADKQRAEQLTETVERRY
eukprot:g1418.t1